uniref:Uncharacterized protein n=1 Tax=Rhizophora mucronata TaxID=61149 RepID=A0A2P2NE25_RHIMU
MDSHKLHTLFMESKVMIAALLILFAKSLNDLARFSKS